MSEPRSPRAFGPIAIVGRGCVVPGAFTPAALWDLVRSRRCALREATLADYPIHPARAAALREEIARPAAGLIDGFEEVFQVEGFAVEAHRLTALDVGVRWLLHAARSALNEARVRVDAGGNEGQRRGVVIGNLSYPSRGLSRYALAVWGATDGSEPAPDPRLRSVSALPARVLADAVGFGDAFALDAACASSLYAIKLRLRSAPRRRADLMLAGGVNAADNLFLHIGLHRARGDEPRRGSSRPFHPRRRRPRARRRAPRCSRSSASTTRAPQGARCSASSAASGSPTTAAAAACSRRPRGQFRAMRTAYASSGLAPRDIGFVECHATGTAAGDAIETGEAADVLRRRGRAAHRLAQGEPRAPAHGGGRRRPDQGAAGDEAGVLPAACEAPTAAAGDLVAAASRRREERRGSRARRAPRRRQRLRLRRQQRSLDRRAPGVEGHASGVVSSSRDAPRLAAADLQVAVVGLSVIAGQDAPTTESFVARWAEAAPGAARACTTIDFDAAALGIPPADLRRALPQHLLFMKAALALDEATLGRLPRERTALYVGMQCDAEAARFALRWRCETPPARSGRRAAHRGRRRGLHAQHHRQPIGPALGPPWPERDAVRGRALRPRGAGACGALSCVRRDRRRDRGRGRSLRRGRSPCGALGARSCGRCRVR